MRHGLARNQSRMSGNQAAQQQHSSLPNFTIISRLMWKPFNKKCPAVYSPVQMHVLSTIRISCPALDLTGACPVTNYRFIRFMRSPLPSSSKSAAYSHGLPPQHSPPDRLPHFVVRSLCLTSSPPSPASSYPTLQPLASNPT